MFSVALLLLLLAAGSCVKCEQLTQPESVTVHPGQRLSITCQVSYSLGSYATNWIRQPAGKALEWIGAARVGYNSVYKDSLKNKFSISLDSSSKTATLNGQNMQPEDSAVYYCARQYGFGGVLYAFDYWGHGTEVTVTSATTASPAVFPLGSCDSVTGNEITLGCVAQDFYPKSVTFVWTTASGTTLDSHQYISTPKNNKYTGVSVIKVPASNSSYECSVKHPGGNQSVTVTYKGSSLSDWTEPKVTVHILPEEDIQQSDKEVTLVCLVSSSKMQNYDITWTEDIRSTIGDETDGINFPPQQTKNGYSVTSVFSTTKKNWDDGYTIKCNVRPVGRKDRKKLRGVSKAMSNAIEC